MQGNELPSLEPRDDIFRNIARPLPRGTTVTYLKPDRTLETGTVIDAGYVTLWIWNENKSMSVIRYSDLYKLELSANGRPPSP